MTPTPPGSRWATLAGNGLTTSKTRKRTKPTATTTGVSGSARTDSVMPATSSTTIAPGSLAPRGASASPAAQVPTTTTATRITARIGVDSERSQRSNAVAALATLPGASGARPRPPAVAMLSARRARTPARSGALADELVSLDLGDAHAREAARREVAPAAQVDDAVDLGRLPRRSPFPLEGGSLAWSVDEDG